MTLENPAGRPADEIDPVESHVANDVDEARDELVEESVDAETYDEAPHEDDVYTDEGYDDEGYDDEGYDDEELVDEEYDDEEYDDEEYDDEEFDDEEFDDEEDETAPKKKKRRRRIRMHCFNCNRPEGFSVASKGRWYYSYFLGLTFGLGSYVGPFKCVCCGHNRLMRYDFLNPRIWVRKPTVETKQV